MKVGDLVTLKTRKTDPPQERFDGIIVNIVKNHYYKLVGIEILWGGGNVSQFSPDLFEVINESR
tara:strand:- start:8572 stop:8763 length:192 start_codon:yes stop_codon:yes gene_type:complete